MRERLLQLLRFSAVGLTCLGIGLAVLYGLDRFAHIEYLIAYVASFVVSNLAGYLLNARFTFLASSVDHAGAVRYMSVNAVLLCANTWAMKVLVADGHLWYMAAAVLIAVINTPITFLAQRVITYRVSRNRPANS